MTRRKDGVTQAGPAFQDGASTPSKHTRDRGRDAAVRLEKFARVPEDPSHGPRSSSSRDRSLSGDREAASSPPLQRGREDSDGLVHPQGPVSTVRGSGGGLNPLPPADQCVEPTMSDIFSAVQGCNASLASLTDQVQGIRSDISFLRHDLQKVRERTTALESRVSDLEDTVTPLQADVKSAMLRATANSTKSDDIENRLRRNNLRVVGMPERTEGSDATAFAESWLLETFGREALSPLFTVERAHRVPSRPLPPGNLPRPLLIRLLNYRDKETILRRAREKGDVSIAGSKVMLFPDFSQEIQRKRAKFQDVKRRLQQLQFSYSMLYPAKLRVVAEGETHFFEVPAQASLWLDKFPKKKQSRT